MTELSTASTKSDRWHATIESGIHEREEGKIRQVAITKQGGKGACALTKAVLNQALVSNWTESMHSPTDRAFFVLASA